jgi:N-acyl-D-amino-acid deacylase
MACESSGSGIAKVTFPRSAIASGILDVKRVKYDLAVLNGRIVDGAGNPWYKADIGISRGRIRLIGRLDGPAREKIDAEGLIVAPGFIDMHSHSDTLLLVNPLAESKIRQGVTTEVIGNCGSSAAPLTEYTREEAKKSAGEVGEKIEWDWLSFDEFLRKLQRNGVALNVAPLVGNAAIRTAVMGFEARKPTSSELLKMKALTARCMEEGAFGLSTGLIYSPSCYARTSEIIELCKVVARYGGIYATHIRGEGDPLISSVREAITIGEEARIPVEISHHKAAGKKNWGKVNKTLAMIQEARDRGVDVTCDVYPYTAGATGLAAGIPSWAHEGGADKLTERLKDPETRKRIRREIQKGILGWENLIGTAGPENILITSCEKHRNYQGKIISELAKAKRKDPLEFIFDLLVEETARVGIVLFMIDEDDMRKVLSSEFTMIGSDASAQAPYGVLGKAKPHPRSYGTFVRVLGKYVRKEGLLTLPEAIRKMTSLPARKLSLWDRGLIRVGNWADLTVFDEDTIEDKATYTNPHQYPTGIKYVIVNGKIVIEGKRHTKALPGIVLRRGRS